jgi:hypothetical protein
MASEAKTADEVLAGMTDAELEALAQAADGSDGDDAPGQSLDEALEFVESADKETLARAVMKDKDYTQKTQALAQTRAEVAAKEKELADKEAELAEREQSFTAQQSDAKTLADYLTELKITATPNDDSDDFDLEDDTEPKQVTLPPEIAQALQEVQAVKDEIAALRVNERVQQITAGVRAELAKHGDVVPEDMLDDVASDILNEYAQSGDAEKGKPITPHIEKRLDILNRYAKTSFRSQVSKLQERGKKGKKSAREGGAGTKGAQGKAEDLEDWTKDLDGFVNNLAKQLPEE